MKNLQYPDGLVEDSFEISDVIGGGEGGATEVSVEQKQGFRRCFLECVQLELHRKLFRQLAEINMIIYN